MKNKSIWELHFCSTPTSTIDSHKRCVLDHLVQPVKSLYLCKYLLHINAAATFEDFCYLYCLSYNARSLTVPDLGPVGLQNTEVGGKGYERGQKTRYNLNTIKQEQNLQPWKSGVQFNVNSYLSEMFTDVHLQKIELIKRLSLQP